MPFGLMIGSPTPRFGESQSRWEKIVSYSNTSACSWGTPTLNCAVSTAIPGLETEYTWSIPRMREITCSAGIAIRLSTSFADAPGKGTSTLAMVTLICGSSSLGVTSTANTPSRNSTKRNQRRELTVLEKAGDAAGNAHECAATPHP